MNSGMDSQHPRLLDCQYELPEEQLSDFVAKRPREHQEGKSRTGSFEFVEYLFGDFDLSSQRTRRSNRVPAGTYCLPDYLNVF